MSKQRFDKWSPLIPKVGQVVQIHFDDGEILELSVTGRETKDGETFIIYLQHPLQAIVLKITPKASGRGMVDNVEGRFPYWQTVPLAGGRPEAVKLFFLD